MIQEKLCDFFKERPGKLEKGYSQDLVKQTVVVNTKTELKMI